MGASGPWYVNLLLPLLTPKILVLIIALLLGFPMLLVSAVIARDAGWIPSLARTSVEQNAKILTNQRQILHAICLECAAEHPGLQRICESDGK